MPERLRCLTLISMLCACCGMATAADTSPRLNQLVATCMACHGVENLPFAVAPGESYTVPRIGLQNPRYIASALQAYKAGDRKNAVMQAQAASLSEDDIQQLGKYFGQQEQGTNANSGVPQKNHAHPSIVEETCHGCHGEIGFGIIKEMPKISHQYKDYMIHSLNDYRNGNRHNSAMTVVAEGLTPQDIQAAAAYYSSQEQPHVLITPASPVELAIKSIEMVEIPSGEFWMGVDPTEDLMFGQPRHRVEIRAFRIGKYPITFDAYDAYANEVGKPLPSDEGWGRSERPVINVNWSDTQAFITWLNVKTGRHFRLPSEAEREYAAAAGTTTDYWWGNAGKSDSDYRNAAGIGGRDQWLYTAPVGQFPPNPFGVYDMVGNVFERTADCWHARYDGAPKDGNAWLRERCYGHVIRGGYWNTPGDANYTRARAAMADDMRSSGIGFRLAEDK
jgi:formylglycine-generating enzyme required for sulfatase activity